MAKRRRRSTSIWSRSIGELTDSDLSTAMTEFFNSLNDVLNQPEDPAVRNLAILRGDGLASQIRQLGQPRARPARDGQRTDCQRRGQVNQLVTEIAKLNTQIIEIEQGGTIVSDAVGLRDKRDKALGGSGQAGEHHVEEQATGAVNVFVGGDYLVFDGATQLVKTVTHADRGLGRGGTAAEQIRRDSCGPRRANWPACSPPATTSWRGSSTNSTRLPAR